MAIKQTKHSRRQVLKLGAGAAFASGVVLPALWAAPGRRGMKVVGDLAAANTFGAIAGAIAAGFVVMPVLGLRGGVLLAIAGYVTAAHVIATPTWRFRSALYGLVVTAVVADLNTEDGRAALGHRGFRVARLD